MAKNLDASVRDRLLRFAQANNQTFDLVLTRFAIERLLYRLSISKQAQSFVLKGAVLLATWLENPYRSTRDLDLLGFGDPAPDTILGAFRDILAIDVRDGIKFNVEALRLDRIRDETEYGGLRLRTIAVVGGARVNLTIDIGFGDALVPDAETVDYPVILDFPAPRLRSYARETMIAEKFQAMVALGRANSRMKDFYDIWLLSRSFAFDNERLARAIAATFARRQTPIPTEPPDALTTSFAADRQKQDQWRAFVVNLAVDPGTLDSVIAELASFLMPKVAAAAAIGQAQYAGKEER